MRTIAKISTMANSLPNTTYREFLLWLLGKRKRLRVEGESMLPLLQPGDQILFAPHAYKKSKPQVEDIIVALHPLQSNLTIIKRIKQSQCDRYFIVGDNLQSSTDSRHWGMIGFANIMGRVTSKFE